jgi:hypothetical protein
MTPLGIDFIGTAALAACVGCAGPKSWKLSIGICLLVAFLAWAGSYLAALLSPSFGGDTAYAEDWINGFSARRSAAEIAVALVWTFLWFGMARVPRLAIERGRKRAT